MSETVQDFELSTAGMVGERFRQLGIARFHQACRFVEDLPYGRVGDGDSPTAVLDEGRGTCSSKHALLARAVEEAGREGIELVIGYLELTEDNAPGIGEFLSRRGLTALPEAHCYLRSDRGRLDCTGLDNGHVTLVDSVLREESISYHTLQSEKRRRHEAYLREWAEERGLEPDDIWSVREAWIALLSSRDQGATKAGAG